MAGEILRLKKTMSKQHGLPRPNEPLRADGDMPQPAEASAGQGDLPLDVSVQAHIGRLLKASYDEMLSQPLPDRLVELLEELDKRERNT